MKTSKGYKLEERKQSHLPSRSCCVLGISGMEGERELHHSVSVSGFWLTSQMSLTREDGM